MRFASQEFFEHLKSELQDENGDEHIYKDLCDMIESETRWKLFNSVEGKENRRDVLQEIKMAVVKGLPEYILNSETMLEAQRQSWLNSIVDHKISDYVKKSGKGIVEPIDKVIIDDNGDEYVPKKIEEATSSMENEPESTYVDEIISGAMGSVLRDMFSIDASPERLVGYVYSKLIIPRIVRSKNSGKPTETERLLKNVTLYDIYDNMVRDFKSVLCSTIDESVFEPLKEKLDRKQEDGSAVGKRRFNLTVRQIVDGTNRINKKVQNMYNVYLERLEGEMNFDDKSHKF